MTSPRSSTSHSVLPPIISNEKDREFLIALNSYIDEELGKVKDRYHPEQRYTVYKAAFDQIIDYVTAYKPLLTAIKAEYEDCIETIQRGQKEAFFLSGKLKAMASEPSTIRNYRKRADELEQRIAVIRGDNDRLRSELEMLRGEREEKERKAREVKEPPKREIKRDRRHIPGLTTEQSTDLKTLTRELEKLERQYKELNISHRTRYAAKDTQLTLKGQLAAKVQNRDKLFEDTEFLKMKRQKLKTAVEAAQAWMKIQPPHQTVGDAVLAALNRQTTQHTKGDADKGGGEEGVPRGTPSTSFEEDDPTREKEAEMMLEYIEKFNELIEDCKYEEAAIHAANSPKGILRTPESLQRFKDLRSEITSSGRSPLLAFCDALMSSVLAFGVRPSEFLSVESVQVAYEENRLDLLSHWISQERVTMSKKLGDLLYQFSQDKPKTAKQCLALAQKVYMDSEQHVSAMLCMVKQGRVNQALEYGKKSKVPHEEYINILKSCPSTPHLPLGLFSHKQAGKSLLPLGLIVHVLIDCENTATALHFLEDIQHRTNPDKNLETPLRKAIFEDQDTTSEQWHEIVQMCQEAGYDELAIDILAAITLQSVMQTAATNAEEIDRLKEEEERKREEEEEEEEAEDEEEEDVKEEEEEKEEMEIKEENEEENIEHTGKPHVEDLGSDQEE